MDGRKAVQKNGKDARKATEVVSASHASLKKHEQTTCQFQIELSFIQAYYNQLQYKMNSLSK